MKINHMNCTIELTKTEMKAAEKFGSEMYMTLREARQDNPNYRVKLVAPSKKVDRHKGLTADAMKKFILKHDDDENQTILKEFYKLRGLTPKGEADEFGCAVTYEKHFVLTADVKVSEQFYGWLLGFGRKAQLVYPATAVEDFKAYLNTVMGLYESC